MEKGVFFGGKALVRRVLIRGYHELRVLSGRVRFRYQPSFTTAAPAIPPYRYFGFVNEHFIAALVTDFSEFPNILQRQAAAGLEHRFDLLGSGPTVVAHGVPCSGVEGVTYSMSQPVQVDRAGRWLEGRINRANLAEAQRLWTLVDHHYTPIDWQLDFKSGYRWREDCWYRDIRFGKCPGADIKVPWELARMQHLPTLALACHFAAAGYPGFLATNAYARELRNQTLDFLANNPPGFGVNWVCAMDVAIRVANLLVARDIALAAGVSFDMEFDAAFAASVKAHATHIAKNLEWSPQFRGNHYLANIVGLLFVAAYLPADGEIDAWLAFSKQELIVEVEHQFHNDGSNFEASVCYHRLSAEMVLWAFALLAALPADKLAVVRPMTRHRTPPRTRDQTLSMQPAPLERRESPVPEWCWIRLGRMADFTEAMTRPDGLVVQFGDNDSGRFITLGSGEQLRADNDPSSHLWSLDHGSLISALRALTGLRKNTSVASDPLGRIVAALAGVGGLCQSGELPLTEVGGEPEWESATASLTATRPACRRRVRFPATSGLLGGLKLAGFSGMGCYVFRSHRLYLAIRCGEIGINGLGAHAHCDQLSVELVIDGQTLARDPGTMVYTPFPDTRNTYRSVKAHHAPRVVGMEPADLKRHIFDLRTAAAGVCLYFGARGFVGRHAGYGPDVYRLILIEDDGVVIHDFTDGNLVLADPTPVPLPFSPGYGRRDTSLGCEP